MGLLQRLFKRQPQDPGVKLFYAYHVRRLSRRRHERHVAFARTFEDLARSLSEADGKPCMTCGDPLKLADLDVGDLVTEATPPDATHGRVRYHGAKGCPVTEVSYQDDDYWESIETAPTDGRPVVVVYGKPNPEGVTAAYFDPDYGMWFSCEGGYGVLQPTHWKRLARWNPYE